MRIVLMPLLLLVLVLGSDGVVHLRGAQGAPPASPAAATQTPPTPTPVADATGRAGGRGGRGAQPPITPFQPQPTLVMPGRNVGDPPSDATILFDGSTMDQWTLNDGSPARCKVDTQQKEMVCSTGDGTIQSKPTFASAQIHLEYNLPDMEPRTIDGVYNPQFKANSGVFIHGRYELQILDSYLNLHRTIPDGIAGAIWRQYAPLVNVSRPPGEWQTYDILIHAPICESEGVLQNQGFITVFHNGVLIQDRVQPRTQATLCTPGVRELSGPIRLQDHMPPSAQNPKGGPMTVLRFRNIWFRPIPNVAQ